MEHILAQLRSSMLRNESNFKHNCDVQEGSNLNCFLSTEQNTERIKAHLCCCLFDIVAAIQFTNYLQLKALHVNQNQDQPIHSQTHRHLLPKGKHLKSTQPLAHLTKKMSDSTPHQDSKSRKKFFGTYYKNKG